MELGFETIGNATLICHDGGPVLATDPWIDGSAYFGSWKLSHAIPDAQRAAITRARYVWFSHGHPDHLNGDSLPALRGRCVLLPDHRGGRIRNDLCGQGFDVQVLPDRAWVQLSPNLRILCIPDYNQDAVLLVDLGGTLLVNLNDASNHGWDRFVRRTMRGFARSFLLALHCFGDADMINFFDESGRRLPLPARGRLGATIARQCELYGARHFVPFSSMHRYQRTDSAWAAQLTATLDDYADGFDGRGCELLPAYIRFDLVRDSFERIDPPATSSELVDPRAFGDDWDEPLEPADGPLLDAYFRRHERLARALDFLHVRCGGRQHTVRFGDDTGRGITLEAPRHSLMTAVRYQIFDDLLIGNFARMTLHGSWGPRPLYPDIAPVVAKYGDNGQARSEVELSAYFADYRQRDPVGWAAHRLERNLILPLREQCSNVVRGSLGPDSRIYRSLKRSYWTVRRVV